MTPTGATPIENDAPGASTAGVWRNRIVGSGEEAPDQLVANPRNWRTHPGEQRDALRGSLSTVGWVQQVLVNQRTGHVVDGHARVEEALSRGEASVPVLYVDLDPDEEALVLATLDPISAMANTDDAKLADLLDGITVDDGGLATLLNALGGSTRKEGLTDPDDVPPEPDDIGVARGDMWALGDHRVICGDATEGSDVGRLLAGTKVDLLWTDPPYGVEYEGKTEERLTIQNDGLGDRGTRTLVADALRHAALRPGGVFYIACPGGPIHLQFLLALEDVSLPLRQTLVWVKDRFVLGHSDYHYRHEPILYGATDGPDEPLDLTAKDHEFVAYGWAPGAAHQRPNSRRLNTVWEIKRPVASRDHPTMKPVELVARAIETSSAPGAAVLDLFAGSGTTVIAAEQTGRRAYAVELDPRYVAVTLRRWEQFTGRSAERIDG